jgi:hypothetical protein
MVFLVKFYSWACGFFFAGDKRRSRPSPGRQMARPCGKTDDEKAAVMNCGFLICSKERSLEGNLGFPFTTC